MVAKSYTLATINKNNEVEMLDWSDRRPDMDLSNYIVALYCWNEEDGETQYVAFDILKGEDGSEAATKLMVEVTGDYQDNVF